ncbi:MAG TPA: oligosaccharide flippase family protein [Gaiellales bacterium]
MGEHAHERAVLRRRSALNFAGLAGATGLQFLLVLVVARLLSRHDVGVFLEAFAVVRLGTIIFAVGLDVTAIRYVAHHAALADDGVSRSVARFCVLGAAAASTVGALALVACAPLLARALHAPPLARALVLMAPAIPFGAVETVLTSISRGRGSMRPYVWIDQLLDGAAKFAFVCGAAYLGYGVDGAAGGYALAAFVPLVAATVVCAPYVRGVAVPARAAARAAVRFSAFQWGTALFGVALLWADSLILGVIRDPGQVAVYSVSIRFALVGIVFVTPVATALQPQIAACFARDELGRLAHLYTYATALSTLLGVLPLALVIVFGRTLISTAFGPQYVTGYAALVAIAAGQAVNAATGPSGYVVSMIGRPDLLLRSGAIALLVNVALCLALVPALGATGAGVAAGSCYAVLNVLRTAFVWRCLRMHPYHGWPLAVTVTLLCATASAYLVEQALPLPAVASAVLGAVAAVAVAAALQTRTALRLSPR